MHAHTHPHSKHLLSIFLCGPAAKETCPHPKRKKTFLNIYAHFEWFTTEEKTDRPLLFKAAASFLPVLLLQQGFSNFCRFYTSTWITIRHTHRETFQVSGSSECWAVSEIVQLVMALPQKAANFLVVRWHGNNFPFRKCTQKIVPVELRKAVQGLIQQPWCQASGRCTICLD